MYANVHEMYNVVNSVYVFYTYLQQQISPVVPVITQ